MRWGAESWRSGLQSDERNPTTLKRTCSIGQASVDSASFAYLTCALFPPDRHDVKALLKSSYSLALVCRSRSTSACNAITASARRKPTSPPASAIVTGFRTRVADPSGGVITVITGVLRTSDMRACSYDCASVV